MLYIVYLGPLKECPQDEITTRWGPMHDTDNFGRCSAPAYFFTWHRHVLQQFNELWDPWLVRAAGVGKEGSTRSTASTNTRPK